MPQRIELRFQSGNERFDFFDTTLAPAFLTGVPFGSLALSGHHHLPAGFLGKAFYLLLGPVSTVRAFKDAQAGLIRLNFPDLSGERINQVAIVRNKQDGARITIQNFLQNFLRRNIQMIGWFIQQQQIGVG